MTKLASIEELRNVLNKSNDSDTNRVMNSALEAVTPAIAGFLVTQFGRQEESDVDLFLPQSHEEHNDGRYVFMLRNSLVVPGSITVRTSLDNAEVTTADPVPDMSLSLDTSRGYVTILPPEMQKRVGHWVSITYLSGFESQSDQIGKVYKNVPDWLKQAALTSAMEVYDAIRKANDSESSGTVERLPGLSINSLAPYRRLKNPVVRPM